MQEMSRRTSESTYVFQEHVHGFMRVWVDGSLKQGEEDVLQDLGKVWY